MKQTLSVAHARQAAPLFVQLSQHEVKKLRQLPAWQRWLFLELVALSDFETGRIYQGSDPRVSYAKLAALLAHDQPPGGPRIAPPSIDQIRRALAAFVQLGLLDRNTGANEGAGALFLAVEGRKSSVAHSANIARGSARGASPKKARRDKNLANTAAGVAPGVAPGVSGGNSLIRSEERRVGKECSEP